MTDPRIIAANTLVDLATKNRLSGNNAIANKMLRDAAELYQAAGETQEAQTCRMLITSE